MNVALWAMWAVAYTGFALHGALSWQGWRNGSPYTSSIVARRAYLWGLAATILGGLAVVTS